MVIVKNTLLAGIVGVEGLSCTISGALMPPMMAERQMMSITNPPPCRRSRWQHDMTMENLTNSRDPVV